MDFAEMIGPEAIMTFHLHGLCNCWHVSANEDEEGMEEKQLLRAVIQAFDFSGKAFKLLTARVCHDFHHFPLPFSKS